MSHVMVWWNMARYKQKKKNAFTLIAWCFLSLSLPLFSLLDGWEICQSWSECETLGLLMSEFIDYVTNKSIMKKAKIKSTKTNKDEHRPKEKT